MNALPKLLIASPAVLLMPLIVPRKSFQTWSDLLPNQRSLIANVDLKTFSRNVTETKLHASILVLAMPTVLKDGPSGHHDRLRSSTVPDRYKFVRVRSGDPYQRLFHVFELDLLPGSLRSTASWWELQHLFIRITRYSWRMYFRLLQG